jgi:hypothetical protein
MDLTKNSISDVVVALNNLPLGESSADMRELTESIRGRNSGSRCLISSIDSIGEDIKLELQEISKQFKIMNESLRVVAQQMRYK